MENLIKDEEGFRKAISDPKIGLTEKSVDRLVRLFKGEPLPREKTKWIASGIIEDNQIVMTDDEWDDMGITLVLFDLCYRGLLQRGNVTK